jgi:hypothetical protein
MKSEAEEFLTVEQLAQRLGWKPKTVQNKMGSIFKKRHSLCASAGAAGHVPMARGARSLRLDPRHSDAGRGEWNKRR